MPEIDIAEAVAHDPLDPRPLVEQNPEGVAQFYRDEAAAARRRGDESYARSDTDGFLSQWASGMTARLNDAKAKLAEQGNQATFWAYEVTDLDGNALMFRRANTRYGFKLVVNVDGPEVWIDPNAREATNARKGVRIARREFTTAAHAHIWSPPGARGTGGCMQVQVIVSPDDRNLKYDGRVA